MREFPFSAHFGATVVVFGGIFGLMLWLNLATPWFADDFTYALDFRDGSRLSIEGLVGSVANSYQTFTGRIVGNTIAQLGTLYPAPFRVLNAAAFVLLILSTVFVLPISVKPHNLWPASFTVFALYWLFHPRFGETMIWPSGSAVYLWHGLLVICFIRLVFNNAFRNNIDPLNASLLFVCGLLSGCGMENSSLAMLAVCVSFVSYVSIVENRRPHWVVVAGLVAAGVGYTLLVISPGNAARMVMYGNASLLERILSNLPRYLGFHIITAPLYFVAGLLVFLAGARQGRRDRRVVLATMLILGALGSNAVMLASPTVPLRAVFGSVVLLGACIGPLLPLAITEWPTLSRLTIAVLFGAVLATIPATVRDYAQLKRIDAVRATQISRARNAGVSELELEPFRVVPTARVFVRDAGFSRDYWVNRYLERYYEIEEIRLSQSAAWDALPISRTVAAPDVGFSGTILREVRQAVVSRGSFVYFMFSDGTHLTPPQFEIRYLTTRNVLRSALTGVLPGKLGRYVWRRREFDSGTIDWHGMDVTSVWIPTMRPIRTIELDHFGPNSTTTWHGKAFAE